MYASSWGYTETPATLNKKLTANGGITADELLVWGAISKLYPQIQNTGLTICNGNAPLSQINASLAAGQPVIVEVDYSPGPGLQTHWVLLYAQQGNDYLVQDPYPFPPETTSVTLMTRFSQGQPLQNAIKAVAWYKCSAGASVPLPPTPPPSTPVPCHPPHRHPRLCPRRSKPIYTFNRWPRRQPVCDCIPSLPQIHLQTLPKCQARNYR